MDSNSGSPQQNDPKAFAITDSPIRYRIDPAQRVVFTDLAGEISFKQSVAFHETLLKDPAFDASFSELVDMRAMTGTTVTSDEMRRLGEDPLFAPASKRAFVTESSLIYGLTRMYEAHCTSHDSRGIRIFSSMDDARTWLGLASNPGADATRAT